MSARIVKICSDGYTVNINGQRIRVVARGKIKHAGGGLCVGDYVDIKDGAINKVHERKNKLIRPRVSNVDAVMIVVASQPKIDFLLVDKVLISAKKACIEPYILVNKTDLGEEALNQITEQYSNVCEIIKVSAKDKLGLEKIKDKLEGKTVVLAGQSAVGKTSLINALFSLSLRVGELSEKTNRGKHTTTYSEIYEDGTISIIDSPGFAVIEVETAEEEVKELYSEYLEYAGKCKFRGCMHIDEPDCAVKNAVESGRLSKERYGRYAEIIKEIKKRRKENGNY